MIKFAALNATEEHSTDGPRKNKEVLESDAFQKYNKALALIKNKDNENAETSLKELLLHPYFDFDSDETFSAADFFNDPAVKLLTSIYKNLGKVHENTCNYDDALDCYLEAVSSDKSDITTWYNIANVAIKKVNYTLACDSLKECLNINPSFWPSIDTLICLLYALGDYLSCLHLIQHSLSLNTNFQRALCVKAQIEIEDPLLFTNFSWKQGFADLKPTDLSPAKEMIYPKELREKDQQAKKISSPYKSDPVLHLREISLEDPLADLGTAIAELFLKGKKEDLSLFCTVAFTKSNLDTVLKHVQNKNDSSTSLENTNEKDKTDVATSSKEEEEETLSKISNEDTSAMITSEKVLEPNPSKELEATKELLRREGQRRSKRVQDQQVDNNESIAPLISQLESWIPDVLKSASDEPAPKPLVSKESEDVEARHKMLDDIDEYELIKQITDDNSVLLVPLMKKYCNQLSGLSSKKWSRTVIKSFLNVYFSYREYEALPNILQNFREQDTEENVLTLLCAFEIIVNNNLFSGGMLDDYDFADVKELITRGSLEKDQEFLKTVNGHDIVKEMFSNDLLYDAFQLRYAWTYCLYEEKLGNIECSLEYVKLCISKLNDCALEDIVVANNRIPLINKAALEKQKEVLVEVQERENVTNLFKDKSYSRVVELLKPMLYEKNDGVDNDNGQVPTRHKNLLILLESLRKMSMMEECLKCGELLLHELVPFLRFTETCKSLLTKIFKSLFVCLKECKIEYSDVNMKYGRIMNSVIKVIVAYFEKRSKEGTPHLVLDDFPIDRALLIYHMIIDRSVPSEDVAGPDVVTCNVARIQSLALCHELLGQYYICSTNSGLFLQYIIECCNNYKTQNIFMEDTTNLFEQAVFCYIGHPGPGSKRSKKNRVDHAADSIKLTKEIAKNVYTFYSPRDGELFNPCMEKTKHVSADTFDLLTQIIALMDTDFTKTDSFLKIKKLIDDGKIESYPEITETEDISNFRDIFYLCGDYLWKYEEFEQAIDWFICDLTINRHHVESWLALGLCWLSIAEDRFNHAKSDLKVVIESIAPKAILCLDHYMSNSETAFDVASEYSCFLYTIASVYNQVAGALSENTSILQSIDSKRIAYITKAKEVLLKGSDPSGPTNWIKSFMLGKISEKLDPKDLTWLDLYMNGFQVLEEYVPTLTKKINSSSPLEYSIECLELAFRVSYSIYKRTADHPELSKDEKMIESLKKILKMMAISNDSIEFCGDSLAKLIVLALEECLVRFPEHYKVRNSLCRIIHDSTTMNIDDSKKAKLLMLQEPTNPSGMFLFTRKHLFLGVWRIPVDVVDRPGGFFRHMRKSLSLMISSLTHCQDIDNLIKLFENMVKTADQLNNFVGDVSPFLQTTLTQFDGLVRSQVYDYCSQSFKHTTEHSIKLLKLCMKVKNIHAKANIATKPVDEAILVLLKLFKLTVPQQLLICNPRIMDEASKLYEIGNRLIADFDQVQKVSQLLDIEKQKKKEVESACSSNSIQPTVAVVNVPESPTDPDVVEVIPSIPAPVTAEKIVVNDNAKSAVRQAVAAFINQMAEKNQGKTNANVSQILNIINSSIKGNKENSSAKIREILLNAVSKPPDQGIAITVNKPKLVDGGNNKAIPISNASNVVKLVSPSSLKNTIPRLQKTISILSKNNCNLMKSISVAKIPTKSTGPTVVINNVKSVPEVTGPTVVISNVKSVDPEVTGPTVVISNVTSLYPEVTQSSTVKLQDQQHGLKASAVSLQKATPQKADKSLENQTEPEKSGEQDNANKTSEENVNNTMPPSNEIVVKEEMQDAELVKIASRPVIVPQKRKCSISPTQSCSDDSGDDEMPSLDDMPSLDSVPTKPATSQFRTMPSLNIAHRDDNSSFSNKSIPILNPPLLVKKEIIAPQTPSTAPYLQSPPPMYCRSGSINKSPNRQNNKCSSSPQHYPTLKADFAKQFLLPSVDGTPAALFNNKRVNQVLISPTDSSRIALTPEQLLALNIPNPKRPKPAKPPRVKKERAPAKKKKLKDDVPKKKKEKKRKIDNAGTLKQFDFPVVEKGTGVENSGIPNGAVFRRGISEQQPSIDNPQSPYYRQSSEPNLRLIDSYGGGMLNQATADERLYKAEDFFADSGSSPQLATSKPGFLGTMPFNQPQPGPVLPSPTGDSSMFSPTSSENMSSENLLDDDSQLENVDLGILNELDGLDFTDEKEKLKQAAPKQKRGRKSKNPNKPKPPSKRKKPKAKAAAEQGNGMFAGMPSNPQFMAPNPQFQFPPQDNNFANNSGGNSPAKHFYYPAEAHFSPSSASKIAMMPASLQPHTVQQPTQLGMAQCSSMQSPVNIPCQFSDKPNFVQSPSPTTLSHFSPDDSVTPKMNFGMQNPPNTFESQNCTYPSNSTSIKQEPLIKQALPTESKADQTVCLDNDFSKGSYVMQYQSQQFNELYPTSLYPDHSYSVASASPTSPSAVPHTNNNNNFNQYQKFRNF